MTAVSTRLRQPRVDLLGRQKPSLFRFSALAIILIGSIAGFPLVVGLATLAGEPSTPFSIAFRASLLACSLLVILRYGIHISNRPLLVLFIAFWIIYFARLAYETTYNSDALARDAATYWSFAAGTCFFPGIAVAAARGVRNGQDLAHWTLVATLIALAMVGLSVHTTMTLDGNVYDVGRYGLDSLNPISFGHLGATVALLAYARLRLAKIRLSTLVLLVAVTIAGLLATLASASRGPLVACAAGIFFVESLKGGRYVVFAALLGIIALLVLTPDFGVIDNVLGSQTSSRFESAIHLADPSTRGRIEQISSAWRIFLDHPLLGGGIEDPKFGIYPHNVFVEAFMATGILGGGVFLTLAVLSTVTAFKIGRRGGAYGALGVLYVQYLTAAQFSGGIYLVYTLWALIGFLSRFPLQPHLRMRARKPGYAGVNPRAASLPGAGYV